MKTLEERVLELVDEIEWGWETGTYGISGLCDELRSLIRLLPEDTRMILVKAE